MGCSYVTIMLRVVISPICLLALLVSIDGKCEAQQFDLLPDIQPASFQVAATVLTDALPVEQERVTEVFTQRVGPIDLVSTPAAGSELLVATYGGTVHRLNPVTGELGAFPFLDLVNPWSPTVSANFDVGGAHGLSSIAFHPEYATPNAAGFGKFYTLEAEVAGSKTGRRNSRGSRK